MKHKASSFLELLNSFVTEYLPGAVGASPNTIKSYKAAFRLLLKYMYQEKGISADQISFEGLDYQTMLDFLSWIEKSRGCSATTKNQRLSALASFSSYAQNRDFAAASTFRSSVTRIPMKKAAYFGRIRTLIPETSGQHFGSIWTAFRNYPDSITAHPDTLSR